MGKGPVQRHAAFPEGREADRQSLGSVPLLGPRPRALSSAGVALRPVCSLLSARSPPGRRPHCACPAEAPQACLWPAHTVAGPSPRSTSPAEPAFGRAPNQPVGCSPERRLPSCSGREPWGVAEGHPSRKQRQSHQGLPLARLLTACRTPEASLSRRHTQGAGGLAAPHAEPLSV